MRSLEAPYKALWLYLLCECDHAGLWVVELDVAQMRMGMKLDTSKAIEKMQGAVVEIDGGARWYLPDFVDFQYGTLNPANRVHASVLERLQRCGIDPNDTSQNKGLVRPLQGAKDKEKDKDIQERKERAKTIEDRKAEFKAHCRAVIDANGTRLADKERKPFLAYWTETTHDGTRMRFEAEKFFDHGRRMDTWMRTATKIASTSNGFKSNGNEKTYDGWTYEDIVAYELKYKAEHDGNYPNSGSTGIPKAYKLYKEWIS